MLLIVVLISGSAGLISTSDSLNKMASTVNVKIMMDKDTGIWRIRDKAGNNKGTMKISKKDKIYYLATGSDTRFIFSKHVDKYFTYDDGLFKDDSTQFLAKNKRLRLTIKDTAPQDTLVYQIYVIDADTFVVGNSPPKLIIR